MDKIKELKIQVRMIFTSYLEQNKQRKTQERYAILDEIYSNKIHLDADQIFHKMQERKYQVSKATVYNTLELLLACGLIKKHQFGQNTAVFEQSFGQKQHDHLICLECNKVIEFCDPRIQQIQDTMGEMLNFKVTHHSLHLYAKPLVKSDSSCMHCNLKIENVN